MSVFAHGRKEVGICIHTNTYAHTHTKSMLTCILGMTSGSADMRAVISHMIMPREKMSACMMNENFDLFHWS